MPTVIINGTTEPIRTRFRESFDPSRGIVTEEEWRMAGGDRLAGLAATYKALGYSYDLISSGRISTLNITSTVPQNGVENVALDQWQMVPNEIQLDIFESPAAQTLGTTSIAKIKRAVQDNADGITVNTSGWAVNEITLWTLVVAGVRYYPVGQHVLRHTTNAWAGYTINVADTNIDAIYTNAQLDSEISNSSYWLYPAPARIQAIVNARASGPTDGGLLRWGWRKLPSQETTGANNRIDITTEYWFGKYPYMIYSSAT